MAYINEEAFGNILEKRIQLFCSEVLGVSLKQYFREFPINYRSANIKNKGKSKTIDFLIITHSNKRIFIELKNGGGEIYLAQALGQLLLYKELDRCSNSSCDRLVLVSSEGNNIVKSIIENNNLGIELIIMTEYRYPWFQD